MSLSIDHVVITVKNLNKTIDFYTRTLEMNIEKNFIKTDDSMRYSLHFGNQKINIHDINNKFKPHARSSKPGSLDICFLTKKNISYWIKKFRKNNIEIIEGPIERLGAVNKLISIYCYDPDGNLIEISNVVDDND